MIRRMLADATYRLPRVRGEDSFLRGAIRAIGHDDHYAIKPDETVR